LVKRGGAKPPLLTDDAGRYVAAPCHAPQGVWAFKAQVVGGFGEGESGGHAWLYFFLKNKKYQTNKTPII